MTNPIFDSLPFYVSRETKELLREYECLLLHWNKRINLIGRSTERDVIGRHLLDSLQIVPFILVDPVEAVFDLGSGAGLPGVVLDVFFKQLDCKDQLVDFVPPRLILVEPNHKKVAFLRDCKRQLGLDFDIIELGAPACFDGFNRLSFVQDFEHLRACSVDRVAIVSRALGSLKMLFDVTADFVFKENNSRHVRFVLHKGMRWQEELQDLRAHVEVRSSMAEFVETCRVLPSCVDDHSVLMCFG